MPALASHWSTEPRVDAGYLPLYANPYDIVTRHE